MMMTQILSQAGALTAGAHLWILPHLEQSQWSHRIDWYLNFRLIKAQLHQSKELSEEFIQLSETWEFPVDHFKIKHSDHLLIASSWLLPNKFTVQIRYEQDPKAWYEKIIQVWNSLGKPSLRIFLPQTLHSDEFQEIIEPLNGPEHITLLNDE